jgi:hypothetical protein
MAQRHSPKESRVELNPKSLLEMNSRPSFPGRAEAGDTSSFLRQNQEESSSEEGRPGFWTRLRSSGEKLTGGGIRAFGKRLIQQFLRRLMWMVIRRPRLMALLHRFLRSFPRLTGPLHRLAEIVDPLAGRPYLPSGKLSKYVDLMTMTLPESSRIIYLKLRAIASDTDSWNRFE